MTARRLRLVEVVCKNRGRSRKCVRNGSLGCVLYDRCDDPYRAPGPCSRMAEEQVARKVIHEEVTWALRGNPESLKPRLSTHGEAEQKEVMGVITEGKKRIEEVKPAPAGKFEKVLAWATIVGIIGSFVQFFRNMGMEMDLLMKSMLPIMIPTLAATVGVVFLTERRNDAAKEAVTQEISSTIYTLLTKPTDAEQEKEQ